jgi:hypothetical protein
MSLRAYQNVIINMLKRKSIGSIFPQYQQYITLLLIQFRITCDAKTFKLIRIKISMSRAGT